MDRPKYGNDPRLIEHVLSADASNPEGSPVAGEPSCLDGSTSLDPLETTAHARYLCNRWQQRCIGRDVQHRAAIIEALHASGSDPLLKRARNICLCCASPAVSVAPDGFVRLRAIRCRDRLCLPCERRRILAAEHRVRQHVATFDSVRLLTLTIVDRGEGLRAQVDRLLECFKRLRRTREWADHVHRGTYALQVTRNTETSSWHAHLHVLVDGSYWQQAAISTLWRGITTDSPIVDIRAVHSRGSATSYVSRYVTRGDSIAAWPPETIVEYAEAMKGVRLFQSFGKAAKSPDRKEVQEQLHPAAENSAPVSWISAAARKGFVPALDAIAALRLLAPAVGALFDDDVARDLYTEPPPDWKTREILLASMCEVERVWQHDPSPPTAAPVFPRSRQSLFEFATEHR